MNENYMLNKFYLKNLYDKNIIEAFEEIPRENFLLPELKRYAYLDSPLSIGYGQTISQMTLVLHMTSLLDPKEDDCILEIGTGSGYQSAILSKLVRHVISVEIIRELFMFARKNISKLNIENISLVCGDATGINFGYDRFDKIIYTAAVNQISRNIKKSLREGGLIVMPYGDMNSQQLVVYEKNKGKLRLKYQGPSVRFVPLRGRFGL